MIRDEGYGTRDDLLEGDVGNDHLLGGADNDTLIGGAGQDTLDGGTAANAGTGTIPKFLGDDAVDTLVGGAGNDTFIIREGNNGFNIRDIIVDQGFTDTNRDTVQFRDKFDAIRPLVPIALTDTVDPNIARSPDLRWVYASNGTTLTVTDVGTGAQGELLDYQDGDYGIRKIDPRANPATTLTLNGDLQPQDVDPATPAVQIGYDSLGNVIVTGEPAPGRADDLSDSTANDRIIAGGGNDIVRGIRGGDDWVSGGDGRDDLRGR